MPHPRRPLLAGNWKMNLVHEAAIRLAGAIRRGLGSVPDRDVAVFPTFVSVAAVAEVLEGCPVRTGGQDCAATPDGAHTGSVSATILRSTGARMVIVGHSERRQHCGDTDELVAAKLRRALEAGLEPILCVGETRAEREQGLTASVVARQLRSAVSGLDPALLRRVLLAYEPVWAIGTGLVATPAQAQAVHGGLRELLRSLFGAVAADVRILYGGSVKASNVDGLMAEPDIDGALVGGASLDAEEFLRIVHYRPV
jgi:triosephosphate isomerase